MNDIDRSLEERLVGVVSNAGLDGIGEELDSSLKEEDDFILGAISSKRFICMLMFIYYYV